MRIDVENVRCRALQGLALALLPAGVLSAADIDFSCMSYDVRGKVQLMERYKEYDVVLRNRCPGPVHWSMCIERIDPLSHEVVETHTPSGYLEEGKTSRVNLQLKKGPEDRAFRRRFQELYVSVGYAVDDRAEARCIARECETKRRDLRRRIDANLAAWEKAHTTLEARMLSECPESGWGKTEEVDTCRTAVRESAQEPLAEFERKDQELWAQLKPKDAVTCALYAGDLAEP